MRIGNDKIYDLMANGQVFKRKSEGGAVQLTGCNETFSLEELIGLLRGLSHKNYSYENKTKMDLFDVKDNFNSLLVKEDAVVEKLNKIGDFFFEIH